MAASDKNKCVKCKNAIKDTEIVLVCGLWCRKTFHNECLGLSNREARAIMCSKVRIKFHCEACEKRLAIELVRGKETQESKNLGNCISLLELVQKLVKLTNELSSDNSTINSKLDTVIRSNTRLEEYLLPSSKRFGKQSEETFDDVVGYARSSSTKRMAETCDRNTYTHSHDRLINSERMCRESEFQGTGNHLQSFEIDFPEQVADRPQHEETFDNDVVYTGSYSTKRITEVCERNSDTISHDQIMNSEPICRESEFQQTEDNLRRIESDVSEQVADGQHQNFTGSYSSNCLQEWGVPEGHESMHDPLSLDEECMQEWEKPNGQDSMQDAPTFGTEECSPPEDFLTSDTFSIEKTENGDDGEKSVMEVEGEKYSSSDNFLQPCTLSTETTRNEEDETVNENNFEEVKHEMESTITSGEAESANLAGAEDDEINDGNGGLVTTSSLTAITGHSMQQTVEQEASCANKIGTRKLGYKSDGKKAVVQRQDLKEQTHMATCELLYSCCICHKTFTKSCYLNRHFRVHTGERAFSCDVCEKTFNRSFDLKRHSLMHTGERPYTCDVCNKTFSQNCQLTKHKRLHTGERSYSCHICLSEFTFYKNWRNHMLLHT